MRGNLQITTVALMIMVLAGCAGSSPTTDPANGSDSTDSAGSIDGAEGADATGSDEGAGGRGSESGTNQGPAQPDATVASAVTPETQSSKSDDDRAPGSADDVIEDGESDPALAVVLRVGGIDSDFAELIESLEATQWVSLVDTAQLHVRRSQDASGRSVDEPPAGFSIQVEARAHTTPEAVAPFAPELVAELAELGDGELILSESSAELRRLDVGATITFDNDASYRVAAVLADSIIGNSEVVLLGPDALNLAGATSSRRLAFVGYDGAGSELEQQLLDASQGAGVRVFGGRGSEDLDRQRTTLSSIDVKQIFGEFAFRSVGPSAIEIDPAWTAANLVTVDLPLLGSAKCHRIFAAILTDVLQGLIDDGLADVIDPGAFQGCWNPRRIAGSARISKHSWGMAADINFGNSLDGGPGSPVNQELLDRMIDADVISGHLWTATPDPGHFEYRGP